MSDWRFRRPPELPLPQPAEEAQPFFDALGRNRLVVQRCASCAAVAHPPRALCSSCQGSEFEWQELSGQGRIYSYVVTRQAVHPAFAGYMPLATVEIELAEGVRLFSNLVDVPPEEIAIGMDVEVVFQDVGEKSGERIVLPLFRRSVRSSSPRAGSD